MFNLFSKKPVPEIAYDQAVILEIDFSSLNNFGDDEQRKALWKFEEELRASLTPPSGLDGDELGEGAATVYLYGKSADTIYQTIVPLLKKSPFTHVDVTLQYGPPDDPMTKDKKFTF